MVEFLKANLKASPMDVLRTAVSMLSLYDPEAKDMSPEANQRKAGKLMSQTSMIVAGLRRLRTGKNYSRRIRTSALPRTSSIASPARSPIP